MQSNNEPADEVLQFAVRVPERDDGKEIVERLGKGDDELFGREERY